MVSFSLYVNWFNNQYNKQATYKCTFLEKLTVAHAHTKLFGIVIIEPATAKKSPETAKMSGYDS